ncbi:MAG: sulfatase-like hydrolase/transferase [Bacteroidales bacterium]|nr:sulfatase-like hydrolase/transferase [Bacteroidales bacterium]
MTQKPLNNSRPGSRILYILAAYAVAILFFTIFRLANTLVYCSSHPTDLEGLYGKALVMGWRFDTLVSCFVLALPLLWVLVGEMTRIGARWYYAVPHYLLCSLFTVCFFACAADIPYFNYFFTRLNAYAADWGDDAGIVIDMIVSEPSYIGFFFAFVAVAVAYWLLMRVLYRRLLKPQPTRYLPIGYTLVLTLVLGAMCFMGMRGRMTMKSPMRVGTAYFCNNAFLNQIGLNPVFSFLKSVEDQKKIINRAIELIDEEEARRIASSEIGTPLPQPLDTIALPEGTNVVLVLMESMSADKVGFFNPKSSLTPNLDSLLRRSLVFTEAYSAGIHTHNGVFSTLFSQPALLSQHTMKRAIIPQMCGLPHALSGAGYTTLFFVTHDSEFDNLNGFLKGNAIEHFYSQQDYPANEVIGTWGVPDHVMLQQAIKHIDALDHSAPFFAACLTCSDHAPYALPDVIGLEYQKTEMSQRMVEYADWSIGQFMRQAAQEPWFKNTLFVFVADHGAGISSIYDMTLSYHHEPLFFYYPGVIEPRQIERPACQVDLSPTLLGMLPAVQWDNHTLGIDLLRKQRPYAYFSADDKIGVVDGEWFYVYRVAEKHESIYRYKDNDPVDYIASEAERAAQMRRYAFGMIQHSQTMLRNGETRCQ